MNARLQTLVGPVALLLALTAQFTGLVHLGVVRHERCVEHGELVEVAVGRVAHEAVERDTVFASAADVDDGDDHCTVAFRVAVHSESGRGAAFALEPIAPGQKPHAGIAAADAAVSIPLLAQAPKTSPPSV